MKLKDCSKSLQLINPCCACCQSLHLHQVQAFCLLCPPMAAQHQGWTSPPFCFEASPHPNWDFLHLQAVLELVQTPPPSQKTDCTNIWIWITSLRGCTLSQADKLIIHTNSISKCQWTAHEPPIIHCMSFEKDKWKHQEGNANLFKRFKSSYHESWSFYSIFSEEFCLTKATENFGVWYYGENVINTTCGTFKTQILWKWQL